jgi:hypothetical protein
MLDVNHIFTIVLAIVQGLLGLIIFFLKSAMAELKGNIHEVKLNLREAESRHTLLVERMPREYVMREEFMRIMSSLEVKLGGLDGKIDRVLEKLTSHVTSEAESSYNRLSVGPKER